MMRPTIDQQVTFLYTRDLKTTAHFYEELMQLPLVLDQGACRIYQVCPNGFIGFCERANAELRHDDIILTIVTEEVTTWHHYLTSKEVPVETSPTLNPQYNIYHFFLRDPNDYLIEIQQFLDPAWPKKIA